MYYICTTATDGGQTSTSHDGDDFATINNPKQKDTMALSLEAFVLHDKNAIANFGHFNFTFGPQANQESCL